MSDPHLSPMSPDVQFSQFGLPGGISSALSTVFPTSQARSQHDGSLSSVSPVARSAISHRHTPRHRLSKYAKNRRLRDVDRKNICLYHIEHPHARQEDIAATFNVERSTVSKILKEKARWLNIFPELNSNEQTSNHRPVKFPEVEERMCTALQAWSEQGVNITDSLIRTRALEIARNLGIGSERFKGSSGWVENFKHRNNIRRGKWLHADHFDLGARDGGNKDQDKRTQGMDIDTNHEHAHHQHEQPQIQQKLGSSVRRGYWNRRGDHLTPDGFIVYAPPDRAYPPELETYPGDDEGYRNHKGAWCPWVERPELQESLPRRGKWPERPYDHFVVYVDRAPRVELLTPHAQGAPETEQKPKDVDSSSEDSPSPIDPWDLDARIAAHRNKRPKSPTSSSSSYGSAQSTRSRASSWSSSASGHIPGTTRDVLEFPFGYPITPA